MANYKTNFGKNLKTLRKYHKLSQTALGEKIGLSRNNIASYESGLVEPSTKNLLKFGLYFKENIQHLLVGDFEQDNKEETTHEDNNQLEVSEEIQVQLDQFTEQTQNMAKILDGYQEFYNMQKDSVQSPQEKDLYNTMDNILDLLRSLVVTNRKLIGMFKN